MFESVGKIAQKEKRVFSDFGELTFRFWGKDFSKTHFLASVLLDMCYRSLPGHDGVMPVLPMKDTVYYSEDGSSVTELVDRSKIFAGQAPELFRLKAYFDANLALLPDKIMQINGASEPAFLAGMDIAMIAGDETNIKITTDSDLKKYIEFYQIQRVHD